MKLRTLGITFFFVSMTFCFSVFFSTADANNVAKLSYRNLYRSCEFQLRFNQSTSYRSFSLDNPPRWVMDFDQNERSLPAIPQIDSVCVVKNLRFGFPQKNIWRLVFDLKQKASPQVYTLPTEHRIKITFPLMQSIGKKQSDQLSFSKRNHVISVKKVAKNSVNLVSKPKPKSMTKSKQIAHLFGQARDVVVVIDPGHGGKDPGATGRLGTHEKDVVLKISRYLQKNINARPGFKAYLTRKGDYYLKLRQRLNIARRYKPDLFIAIHADAFRNHRAHGASVFALSPLGATTEAARWLAKQENDSELMGGIELSDKAHMLRSVLIDLSQTATIGSSIQIGNDVLDQLRRQTSLHHNQVAQAAFVVLKSPDIPSLLIETGFLSNRREERKLRQSKYQNRIAASIGRGIYQYFSNHPPHNSWLALRSNPWFSYRVKKGDTLSNVAQHYGISVVALKKKNNLKSVNLHVGQLLSIPKVDVSD